MYLSIEQGEACLGCARKLARCQDSEGLWYLDLNPNDYAMCRDGMHHVCSGKQKSEEEE